MDTTQHDLCIVLLHSVHDQHLSATPVLPCIDFHIQSKPRCLFAAPQCFSYIYISINIGHA